MGLARAITQLSVEGKAAQRVGAEPVEKESGEVKLNFVDELPQGTVEEVSFTAGTASNSSSRCSCSSEADPG